MPVLTVTAIVLFLQKSMDAISTYEDWKRFFALLLDRRVAARLSCLGIVLSRFTRSLPSDQRLANELRSHRRYIHLMDMKTISFTVVTVIIMSVATIPHDVMWYRYRGICVDAGRRAESCSGNNSLQDNSCFPAWLNSPFFSLLSSTCHRVDPFSSMT